jgi:Antirepressor regulating drug resistance, predicted signal transduction N-terminal membrane component
MNVLTIATLALRITAVLGTVGAINAVRRRASAGSRHWLWMLALAGIVIMPVATRFGPPIPILPSSASTMSTNAPNAERLSLKAAPVPAVVKYRASVTANAQVNSPTIASVPDHTPDPSAAIVILWAAGSLLLLARLGHAHIIARRVVKRSNAVTPAISGQAAVRFSNEIDLPFTYGLLEPAVILPRAALSWPAQQMEATLTHEQAHAKRGDGIALVMSQIVVALYWWHPAVWYAARAAAADRERACDDAVLRNGMRPSDYGQCLLAHADSVDAWRSSPVATVMFGHSAGLGARVSALLDPAIDRSSGTRPKMAAITGILAVVAVVGAAAPRKLHEGRITTRSDIKPSLSLVNTSMVPTNTPVETKPIKAGPVIPHVSSEALVCHQAKDSRQARTYKDAAVHITGAGATFNDGVTREIWTGVDCIAWLQYSGSVDATADEKNIVVSSGGRFIAHNEGPEGTREYRVTPESVALTLNGNTVAIGASEQGWIAGMVREYLRRSGKRAHERAHVALTSGIPSLLAEAAGVPKMDIRAQYLAEGFAATHDAQSVARYIHDGAALLDSLDSRATFLVSVPTAYKSDVTVLTAIYEEASVIEPDGAVDKVLDSTSPPRPLPAVLRPLMEKIIAGISNSDRQPAMRAYYLGIKP